MKNLRKMTSYGMMKWCTPREGVAIVIYAS